MEKAAITGYSIVKPSRAKKDKNEDVFTNEQYQAIALNSLLKNIRMTKKELYISGNSIYRYTMGVDDWRLS